MYENNIIQPYKSFPLFPFYFNTQDRKGGEFFLKTMKIKFFFRHWTCGLTRFFISIWQISNRENSVMETQTTERSYKDDHLQDRLRHYEAQAQLVETLQRELHNSQVRATVSQKNHSLSLHPPPPKREREGRKNVLWMKSSQKVWKVILHHSISSVIAIRTDFTWY